MRARLLFAATVGALFVTVATPASAKWMIAQARIAGPGVGGSGLRISGPALEGLWDSGIDVAGGLDGARPESVEELGLTPAELGPRYVITYRVEAGTRTAEIVQQELYPYTKDGPVTYMPPGQRIAKGLPWGGVISSGWYQCPRRFLRYLVDEGLPETSPIVADPDSVPDPTPETRPMPLGWIVAALGGLLALLLAVPRLRRRLQ